MGASAAAAGDRAAAPPAGPRFFSCLAAALAGSGLRCFGVGRSPLLLIGGWLPGPFSFSSPFFSLAICCSGIACARAGVFVQGHQRFRSGFLELRCSPSHAQLLRGVCAAVPHWSQLRSCWQALRRHNCYAGARRPSPNVSMRVSRPRGSTAASPPGRCCLFAGVYDASCRLPRADKTGREPRRRRDNETYPELMLPDAAMRWPVSRQARPAFDLRARRADTPVTAQQEHSNCAGSSKPIAPPGGRGDERRSTSISRPPQPKNKRPTRLRARSRGHRSRGQPAAIQRQPAAARRGRPRRDEVEAASWWKAGSRRKRTGAQLHGASGENAEVATTAAPPAWLGDGTGRYRRQYGPCH